MAVALLCFQSRTVFANPLDGKVSAGQATISEAGKKLDVHQQSHRAVIDWRGFDIAPDEHTQFHQPGTNSVTLNRVHTNRASHIDGRITANGNVVIVNQNGVFFGKNAQVDVNGLIATTADIDNRNFMRGRMKFDRPGNPNASIVNEGRITAKEAGLVGLVAPNVVNSGVINARLGRVHLGSGDTTTVDLYGDGLLEIAISKKVKSQLVVNTGKIHADGGKVAITAAAGRQIVNSLISVGGEVRAAGVGKRKGEITIYGEGANAVKNNITKNKSQKSGFSNLLISGVLDASGRNAGESGGMITVTGDNVTLSSTARVDASGAAGGGEIKIGGDYLGKGATPAAKTLTVEAGATIYNDALQTGDGGRSIFWSDSDTSFKGSIYARGGALGGNGGFVETSSKKTLLSGGFVDLTAAAGETGLWLLDPTNITIFNRSGTGDQINTFTTAQLEAMSVGANVALNADNNITLDFTNDNLNFTTAGRTFTLTAGNNITTASAGGFTTNNAAISFNAVNGINLNHQYNIDTNGGTINMNNNVSLGASQAWSSVGGDINVLGTVNGLQNLTLSAGAGTVTFNGAVGGITPLFSLNIAANGLNLGANIAGSGILTIAPGSFGTTMGIAGGAGTLNLDATEVARLVNGWNTINLGGTNTGAITVNAASWNDPLTLMTGGSGVITIAGAQTMGANDLIIQTSSDPVFNAPLSGTGTLTIQPQFTNSTIGLGGGAGTLNLSTSDLAQIADGWGSILIGSISGSTAMTVNAASWNDPLTLRSSTGVITIAGTQTMGANNLTLQSNADPVLNAALTGSGTLTLQPQSAGTTIGVGGGAGTFNLSGTDLAQITDGWGVINIGRIDGSGAMTVNAASWNDPLNLRSSSGVITIAGAQAMGANNLAIQTNSNLALNAALTGSGTLTIQPQNGFITVGLGGAAGTLNLTAAEIAQITDGWGSIVIGSSDSATTSITANALTWNDPLTLLSAGNITVAGAQTMGANALTLQTNGDLALNAALTGSGALTIQPINAGNSVGLAGGVGTLNLSTADLAQITDGWGSITIGNSASTQVMNVNAATWNDPLILRTLTGIMTIAGAQSMGANNLTLQTDSDLVLNAALTGTGALTIQPASAGTTIGLSGGAGTLNLGIAELARLTDGWGSITIGRSNGSGLMTVNAATWNDPLSLFNGSGGITFAGAQTLGANSLLARTFGAGNITLNSGAITSTGAGTPITLASGGNFINNVGASALSANNGRWLVYSTNPANDTIGSLSNNFRRFSCSFGGSCPALGGGNGLLYSTTPILTATPSSIGLAYGDAVPSLTGYAYNLSGYLDSDSGSDSIGGSLNGSTTYTQGGNVGTYDINYASGALTSALGYGFTYANNPSAISVGQRTITASLTGTVSKIYDRLTSATLVLGNYLLSGVQGADDVTVANFASGTYDNKNVGTGKTVSVNGLTLTGAQAGNYTLASSSINGGVGIITPAALSISGVVANNKVYDATTVATLNNGAAALLGVILGDTVTLDASGSSGAFTDKNVGTAKSVSASGYGISGADAGNYALSQPSGLTADITSAALAIIGVSANHKVYDGTITASLDNSFAELSGLIGSDVVNLDTSGSSGAFLNKNVGNGKSVSTSGYAISGADSGNYTLSQPLGLTANITPASLTVSGVTANNKVYDGLLAAILSTGSAALNGVIGGDTVNLDASSASGSFADKSAGTGKAVTASGFSIFGADFGNYVLSQPSGLTADITPASLSISGVIANSKVYDATAVAILNNGSAALNGILGLDIVNLDASGSSGVFVDKNVGINKSVSASGYAISGADSGNYTLTQPTGLSANVTPAALSIAGVAANDKVYDGTSIATLNNGAAALNGVLGSDTVNLDSSSSSGAFVDKNVGNGKSVSASGYAISGADSNNYILTQPAGLAANITPKGLTVTADNKNKIFGANDPVLTYNYSGLAVGDISASFTGALARTSGENVGIYTITQNTLSAIGNYSIGPFVSGIFEIEPAAIAMVSIPDIVLRVEPIINYADPSAPLSVETLQAQEDANVAYEAQEQPSQFAISSPATVKKSRHYRRKPLRKPNLAKAA